MYCSSQKERTVDKICLFLRALHMDRISKLGGNFVTPNGGFHGHVEYPKWMGS